MLKPIKLYSNGTNDFNETLKHTLLMCSNVIGNNNKFYSLEIQKNNSNEYALFSHYGRITGDIIKGGVYELRMKYYSLSEVTKDFNSIIKKKKTGKIITKNNEKYRESYKEMDVISSSVGSSNIKQKELLVANSKSKLNNEVFKNFDSIEKKTLEMLENENIHEITNSTSLKYTSNGLQTPLGPLTIKHLTSAKKVLNNISLEMKNLQQKNKVTKELKMLNNEYLSLIPRNLGNNITDEDLIITGSNVMREYDLLTQMETSIKITKMKDSEEELDIGFSFKIASIKIQREIEEQINKTRKHQKLNKYKLKRVYEIENKKERNIFELKADSIKKKELIVPKNHRLDYKEVDLFHGSRNSNILSILMNGFYVPPRSAPHVTARMFGNGVYGADISTKAMNYSAGFWGGTPNKNKNIFCFVVRFALGKVYEAKKAMKSGIPNGYDSIFSPGGYDLENNEYIVPDINQTTMSYLAEFE